MFYLLHILATILLAVSVSFAQAPELKPPSCIRIISSTGTEAMIQFEPHGGTSFEAERYVSSKWRSYSTSVKTTGKKSSVIVPLSKSMMNIIRICAEENGVRVCSEEGVHAKR